MTGPGPWRYNCAAGAPGAPSGDPGGAFAPPPPVVAPDAVDPAPVANKSIFATFAEGGDTVVDRLASNGFVPAGCIDAGNGVVKVAMKSRYRTHFVTLAEVKRSKIAPLVICRL